jgi:hypothetical protein
MRFNLNRVPRPCAIHMGALRHKSRHAILTLVVGGWQSTLTGACYSLRPMRFNLNRVPWPSTVIVVMFFQAESWHDMHVCDTTTRQMKDMLTPDGTRRTGWPRMEQEGGDNEVSMRDTQPSSESNVLFGTLQSAGHGCSLHTVCNLCPWDIKGKKHLPCKGSATHFS